MLFRSPIGFDIEVAKALAEKMGLTVEYKDTAWDGIFASLDRGDFDCIISAVSITDERKGTYNLTDAYIANRLVLVTAKDAGISSPEELNDKKVAVQTETTADDYMTDLQEAGTVSLAKYSEYDKVMQCFDDLLYGRVDAVLCDSVVAAYYLGDDADDFEMPWESPEAEPMAICIKKGNDALSTAVESAIDELYADGTMETIAVKYFGSNITEIGRASCRERVLRSV